MANSNHNKSAGLISQAFGVAKKLSHTGLDLVNHVAPGSVSKLDQITPQDHIVESTTNEKNMSDKNTYENPQQLFRNHVPKVTQQLLGRHFNKVNNVASFISPDINNKISDFFFDKLNDFISAQSSVDHLLKEVGAKDLAELAADPKRANRIGVALANQNKTVAALAGAISGASGVIGTAIDIPLSLALTLKTIYQSGRAHGFELDHKNEQQVVEYVFRAVDFGSIAEKQTLLVALRAFSNLLETKDTQQLQRMLGSNNDFEALRKWLSNEDGSFKWGWLNHVPQISFVSKLTPIAGAGIGAVYSWKLIEDTNLKAQEIFSGAQQYALQHPDEKHDVLTAYEKYQTLLAAATPLLTSQEAPSNESTSADSKDSSAAVDKALELSPEPQQVENPDNQVIKKVVIKAKSDVEEAPEQSIEQGLQKLADEYVEPVDEKTSQVSLADKGGIDEFDSAVEESDEVVDAQAKGEAIVSKAAATQKESKSKSAVSSEKEQAHAKAIEDKKNPKKLTNSTENKAALKNTEDKKQP